MTIHECIEASKGDYRNEGMVYIVLNELKLTSLILKSVEECKGKSICGYENIEQNTKDNTIDFIISMLKGGK